MSISPSTYYHFTFSRCWEPSSSTNGNLHVAKLHRRWRYNSPRINWSGGSTDITLTTFGFSCISEAVFATLPRMKRGCASVLHGDPKGKNFLYTNGNSVIIRDIEVCTKYLVLFSLIDRLALWGMK